MYLFVDTETTGLPPSTPDILSLWPRLVEFGWLLTDDRGKILKQDNAIVRPEGFYIPHRVTKIHGITTRIAREKGRPLDQVLLSFLEALRFCTLLIGHNIEYDYHVLKAELSRKKIQSLFSRYPRFCTMKTPGVIEYCKMLRGDNQRRWPRLSELYYYIFQQELNDAHHAYDDAKACAQCFFALKNMGVL